MEKIKDLGMRYPKETSKQRRGYGLYLCECGAEFEVQTRSVKNGNTQSCGCYQKQRLSEAKTTHGLKGTRIYRIWKDMKARCYNPKNPKYHRYGGRGITICDEWKNDAKAFYDWAMTNGCEKGLSIDRIDNDGNYEPSNCRWATRTQQNRNQSTTIIKSIEHARQLRQWWAAGIYDSIGEMSRYVKVPYGPLYAVLQNRTWKEEIINS